MLALAEPRSLIHLQGGALVALSCCRPRLGRGIPGNPGTRGRRCFSSEREVKDEKETPEPPRLETGNSYKFCILVEDILSLYQNVPSIQYIPVFGDCFASSAIFVDFLRWF